MKFIILLCISLSLYAHSLKIFTTQDENFIHLKAYFSAKSPCIDCNITVLRYKDKEPFLCKSDNLGKADISLSLNPKKIIVNGGLGHQNSIDIKENQKENTTELPYPFWLRIVFSLACLFLFFGIFWWIKKK